MMVPHTRQATQVFTLASSGDEGASGTTRQEARVVTGPRRSRLNRVRPALLVLALASGAAIAATADQVPDYMAAAASHVKTDEARAALKAGPPAEYYRWGGEICTWTRLGKSSLAETQANLAQFFGPDLASALVFAALKVICPEVR